MGFELFKVLYPLYIIFRGGVAYGGIPPAGGSEVYGLGRGILILKTYEVFQMVCIYLLCNLFI
jgi:hypothetical protein